jgi:hypothetical protein
MERSDEDRHAHAKSKTKGLALAATLAPSVVLALGGASSLVRSGGGRQTAGSDAGLGSVGRWLEHRSPPPHRHG